MEVILFIFIIGVVIGSFLNVLIDRLSTNRPILNSRSICDSCKKQLKWYELFPLFSYLYQRGKCRHCHARIPLRVFIVELVTGIIYVSLYTALIPAFSLPVLLFALVVASCLLVIFQIDVEYGIIPDQILIVLTVLAMTYLVFFSRSQLVEHLLMAFASFLVFFLLFVGTSGRGMGFGDVKFSFVIGLLLGYPGALAAIYFAFLTGALVSIILIVSGRKKFKKDSIAFGPFLVIGMVIYYLFGDAIQMYLHTFGL